MKKLSNSVSVSELMHMREELGMTNKQIAERLGISYMTVKRYIGNQPEGMRAAPKRKEKPLPPVETVAVEPAPVLSFTERLAAMQEKQGVPTVTYEVTAADLALLEETATPAVEEELEWNEGFKITSQTIRAESASARYTIDNMERTVKMTYKSSAGHKVFTKKELEDYIEELMQVAQLMEG